MERWILVCGAFVAVMIAVVLVILWRALVYRTFDPRADPDAFAAFDQGRELDALVEDLLGRMSVREKLGQLRGDIATLRFSMRYLMGIVSVRGVPLVYSGRNARLSIPPLAFSDGPRGVNVGKGCTAFPVTMARGASFNRDLERRVGAAIGAETRAVGANYSGAVCVNLLRHPGWGRAQETYGEDSFHLGEMGVALTLGIQSQNVMACVKHFALNSIENARFYVDVEVEERTLREVYLPHFRKIVQEGGVASVMSAYNKFRGEHCGHSHYLLTKVLREEWGFEGFVTSDWLHGVRDGVKGLTAGMDVEMPARNRYGRPLLRAVQRGQVSMEAVNRSVRRVLRTRMHYALRPDPREYPRSVLACEDHRALAQEAAEESMVLLKNDEVLPLDSALVRHLVVVGRLANVPNTGDMGSSAVRSPYVCTAAQGLTEAVERLGGQVEVFDGTDLNAAEQAARKADAVILVVGFSAEDEGEYFVLNPNRGANAWRPPFFGGGGDRADLALRPEDLAIIHRLGSINPRTVVNYVGGSAVTLEWAERVPAILFSWYSGMEGGNALARVVLGEVNPSGKMPLSIPVDAQYWPDFDPWSDSANYDGLHGYQRFQQLDVPMAAPFGFGLSYTKFRLGECTLRVEDELVVEVEVTNTGLVAGAEVVQLYVKHAMECADKQIGALCGFEKLFLGPGESGSVRFSVAEGGLARWNAAEGKWNAKGGVIQLSVGTSCLFRDCKTRTAEFMDGGWIFESSSVAE